jgi:nitroimidazol reductase NimA-like FMN-containing flavoprotein (pyridoxamine 5'-phosphate oxidase superfamily)
MENPTRLLQPPAVLNTLTRSECLRLLRGHQFGRLATTVDGDPMIFPVNYVMDGYTVAVRTDARSGIDTSILRNVAFEVDHIDAESHEGWSVVVRGVARDITDALDPASEHTRSLPLTPWAPGFKTKWIKILTLTITGRRLVATPS